MAVPHSAIGPLDSSNKEEISWELLQHSPYSPDLAPSNFNLFEPQNESLGDIKFKNDEDVLQQNV